MAHMVKFYQVYKDRIILGLPDIRLHTIGTNEGVSCRGGSLPQHVLGRKLAE